MRVLNDEEIKKVLEDYANIGTVELLHVRRSYGEELGEIVAQAQHDFDMKEFVEWGMGICPHLPDANFRKASCLECWQALQQQAEQVKGR